MSLHVKKKIRVAKSVTHYLRADLRGYKFTSKPSPKLELARKDLLTVTVILCCRPVCAYRAHTCASLTHLLRSAITRTCPKKLVVIFNY